MNLLNKYNTGILFLLLTFAAVASGQTPEKPANSGTALSLKFTAAAEADPALRYVFWPQVNARVESNAMAWFSRAILFMTESEVRDDDIGQHYQTWVDQAWKETFADEIKSYLVGFDATLDQLECATDLMVVDYPLQTRNMSLTDYYSLMLPEIQASRDLVRLLALRARVEMHSGDWEAFTRTMQTMFRLSDMIGNSTEFLVSKLVAIAAAELTLQCIEEAIAIPGSPNFYWALAAVPSSLCNVDNCVDREVFAPLRLLPELQQLPDKPIGQAESRVLLKRWIDRINEVVRNTWHHLPSDDPNLVSLLSGLALIGSAESSREYLRTTTFWGERAAELSTSEVILRATAIQLEQKTHAYAKWNLLPEEIRLAHLSHSEDVLTHDSVDLETAIAPANRLINFLLPAMQGSHAAALRFKQTRARLATIEAIRMATAKHAELPDSINDLVPPAWPDPFTNTGFHYQKTGEITATLTRAQFTDVSKATEFRLELVQ